MNCFSNIISKLIRKNQNDLLAKHIIKDLFYSESNEWVFRDVRDINYKYPIRISVNDYETNACYAMVRAFKHYPEILDNILVSTKGMFLYNKYIK